MLVNTATVLLRFLFTLLVLALLAALTLHTRLAWLGYIAIIVGTVVLLALGVLAGLSLRRLR